MKKASKNTGRESQALRDEGKGARVSFDAGAADTLSTEQLPASNCSLLVLAPWKELGNHDGRMPDEPWVLLSATISSKLEGSHPYRADTNISSDNSVSATAWHDVLG